MPTRRTFLQSITALTCINPKLLIALPAPATTLPKWTPGNLDIHHLAYGRGNSTFVLAPDATTLLIDAGTTEDSLAVSSAQKPNANLRPGQWIASYIARLMHDANRQSLDYFLLTHIHPDHLGDLGPENPTAPDGTYRLTGVMDVDARISLTTLIDRGFPDYAYPAPQRAPFATNYLAYIKSRTAAKKTCERFHPGANDQIRLRQHPGSYPTFSVRNLAANGEVWTGVGNQTRALFPDLKTLSEPDYPTENMCSLALRLSYGKFDYFTGGDLTSDTEETNQPWRDIETPVAKAAGHVEVAVTNHHAYYDAVGPGFVRALQPRVFIIPSWYVAHPTILPLRRMLSQRLYPGNRDLFATNIMPANGSVNNQFISKLKSLEGHILVRVPPPGNEFSVFILDNTSDSLSIKSTVGPYTCN